MNEPYFNDYLKFGVIRNPWDRMLSYYNLKKYRSERNPTKFLPEKKLQNGFAYWVKTRKDYSLKHTFAIGDKLALDECIRFENLNEDFSNVMKKMGIEIELPHKNKAPKYDDFTSESIRTITKECQWEIDLFGYKI